MAEREKVIAALEWCIEKPCNPKCPYFSQEDKAQAYCLFKKIMPDALALLKEQEARVMTLEEVEEMAAKSDPDPICAEWSTGRTGWVVGSIHLVAAMMKNGNRDIRVWTSRPTPDQMRDTPWEGEEDHEA